MLETRTASKEQQHWDRFWLEIAPEAPVDLEQIEQSSLFQYLKRNLPPKKTRLLEAGCGEGVESLLISRQENLSCHLLDFSPRALHRARQASVQVGLRPELTRGDLLHLPFADHTFDVVWNEGVNEHFQGPDRQRVFDEMARVCRPGGHVLLLVPVGMLWHFIVGLRHAFRLDLYYEEPFGVREARQRIRNAGLQIRHQACFQTLAVVRNAWGHLSSALFHRPLKGSLGPTFASKGGQRLTRRLARLADATQVGRFTGCMFAVTSLKPHTHASTFN